MRLSDGRALRWQDGVVQIQQNPGDRYREDEAALAGLAKTYLRRVERATEALAAARDALRTAKADYRRFMALLQ